MDPLSFSNLHLTVVRCRNLNDPGLLGKADPYLLVRSGHSHKKSKVQSNAGANPEFNAQFEVPVSQSHREITIEIWDKDVLNPDDLMGKVIFNLSELNNGQEADHWLTVINKHGKPVGEMQIRARGDGPPAEGSKLHDVLHNPIGAIKDMLHK